MINAHDYVQAVAERLGTTDADFAMLPTLLAAACVDVLPIAGAGLSITSDLRLPLASSDPTAALAEQLQTTLGTGPCLAAAGQAEPRCYDEAAIAERWPLYHHQLRQHTPYRSVLSMPLVFGGFVGALDLYSTDPTATEFPYHDDIWTAVGEPITELMIDVPTLEDQVGLELPAWLVTEGVDTRLDVWVAVGIVMQHHGLDSADALALLRGYAYSHNRTLDQVAADLHHHRLNADDIPPD